MDRIPCKDIIDVIDANDGRFIPGIWQLFTFRQILDHYQKPYDAILNPCHDILSPYFYNILGLHDIRPFFTQASFLLPNFNTQKSWLP